MTRRTSICSAALALSVAFLALTVVAAREPSPALDRAIAALMKIGRHPLVDPSMQALSFLGSGYAIVPLSILTVFLMWRRRHPLTLFFSGVFAGAILFELLVKWMVARPRPRGTAYAFPSGHVLTSVVFFGVLVYLLWTQRASRRWRVAGTAGCVLAVVGIAYSRLYFNVHWLTDVLGGLTGGTAYLLTAITWGATRAGAIEERARSVFRR